MGMNSLLKRMLRNRLLWAAVIIVVSSLLLVQFSPYLIKIGIERALTSLGGEPSEVLEVDFNLFSGTLVVHGLSAGPEGEKSFKAGKVTMQFGLRPLFRKRLIINKVDIQDAVISVEHLKDGGIVIGGLMQAPTTDMAGSEKRPLSWLININDISAINTLFHYITEKEDITITTGRLAVSGQTTFGPGSSLETASIFSYEGNVIVEKLDVRSKVFEAFEKKISWKGSILATFKGDGNPPEILSHGRIKGSGSVISLPERGLRLQHNGLVANVNRKQGSASEKNSLFDNASVSGVSVDSLKQRVRLLSAGSTGVDGVGYDNGRLTIGSVKLKEVSAGRFLAEELEAETGLGRPFFSASEVGVSNIQVAELMKVTTGTMELSGAKLLLRFASDGGLYMMKELIEALDHGERSRSPKPGVAMSSILVSKGSSVRFEDERIETPYRTTLQIDMAKIEKIKSNRPKQLSAITLKGTIDEYTRVVLAGNIQPFTDRLTLNLTGRIEELDLPPLTPYTKRHLGFVVDNGHMNTDITLNIVEGKVDGSGELALSNLNVSPRPEEMKKLTAELPMPLDTALSLLRDKNNKIHLTLSVQGDIRDPTLNIGNMINKAVGEAVKKASVSYLKYYFQPYGTYITVIKLADVMAANAMRVRLDPVYFERGSTDLDATVLQYLERVAGLITDRSGLQVKLCGKAVASDLTGMKKEIDAEEWLQALARERATTLKDYLVQQHAIMAERLFICNPETDSQEDSRPRVELLL